MTTPDEKELSDMDMLDRDSSLQVTWGDPVNGLRLGIAGGNTAELYLRNVGVSAFDVWSYVNAQERQYDWFTLHLEDTMGNKRTILLMNDRDKSAPIRVHLAPGETVHHSIDVRHWVAPYVHVETPIVPGAYSVSVTYEVPSADTTVWNGILKAGPIKVVIPAK